ncbi:unnamed protein product [Blumeria hordei]|uniref:SAC domain-containing protein n=1 Tax=Blumeria hordei TaxID=2867405 RepID=A0A383UWL2_BLUHO|nr:unnamed protein product [Blumeria hordei]
MPGLARRVLIFAGSDGLVLQPIVPKDKRVTPSSTKILWKTGKLETRSKEESESQDSDKYFEAYGIIGLLNVSNSYFLISIIKRQQVAQIQGKPIYAVTEIAVTTLESKVHAEISIAHTQKLLPKECSETDYSDIGDITDSDEYEDDDAVSNDKDINYDNIFKQNPSSLPRHRRTSSVAEDVIAKKGGYGRFGINWFSSKGWTVDQRRNLGMSDPETNTPVQKESEIKLENISETEPEESVIKNDLINQAVKVGSKKRNTLSKLLRTIQLLFGSSKNFYFSYDWDITRSFKDQKTTHPEIPFHTKTQAKFFWNSHLLEPFIDSGLTSLCLPLMQGFIGQKSFRVCSKQPISPFVTDGAENTLEESAGSLRKDSKSLKLRTSNHHNLDLSDDTNNIETSYLLTLISRRSIRRAGLRYLRRGVDENGFTANFVETEQILSDTSWNPSRRIHSFVQIRGSIPIFWSQLPYSFKPVPQLKHGEYINLEGYRAHVKDLMSTYGNLEAVSLVEKNGPESIVGMEYEKIVNCLNSEISKNNRQLVSFMWWDFHANCRGLKFENVSLLIDLLSEKLVAHGDTCIIDGRVESRQSGVIRTNCMDCLDRTNVTQSACGRWVLASQLKREGVNSSLQDLNMDWFNNIWADNGDAISKQYASTSALKGDFTRHRKRELSGALKDIGLSVSRFYNGIFNDYFGQAAIDFLLGNVTELIFEEFEERFMTADPAFSVQKLHRHAIEICQSQVIVDQGEEFIGGWILLTPVQPNTIKPTSLEESVLLITDAALYSCRINWSSEKITSFERINLKDVGNISFGTYVTSTLSAAQMDTNRNFGLLITYEDKGSPIQLAPGSNYSNLTSNTEHTLEAVSENYASTNSLALTELELLASPKNRVLAFKAIPSSSIVTGENETVMSEVDQIKLICYEIERMIKNCRIKDADSGTPFVQRKDIISLVEAKKSTGLIEQLSHTLKRLVWA